MNRTNHLPKMLIFLVLVLMVVPAPIAALNSGPSLGIILGSPTGFTMKYVFARTSAISVNAGWGLLGDARFHGTCDYQFLFPQTLRWRDEFEGESHEMTGLTPYFGVGGRLLVADRAPPDDGTELNVGVRLGGGVEYDINRFGVFLEIYPVVDIIPETGFTIEGGLGFRFYFSGK